MAEAFFAIHLREDGVLLVRGRFCYPKEDAFCRELATRAEAWLRGPLFERAKRIYAEDATPKKRFLFSRFDYSFALTRTDEAFLVSVSLSREGRELSAYESALTICDGLFSPQQLKIQKTY